MIAENPQIARQLKNIFPETFLKGAREIFAKQAIFPVLLRLLTPDSVNEQRQADQAAMDILHPREAAILSRYTFAKRRSEYFTGRACAKMAVQGFFAHNNAEPASVLLPQIEIANRDGGRPVVRLHGIKAAPPKLDISISHSGDYGVALAAELHCGIDLQEKKDALIKVREKYCSKDEHMLLERNLPDHGGLSRLAMLWAAKEAAKKALSDRQVPGFLDLELRLLNNFTGWSAFHLYVSHQKNQLHPEKVIVAAGMFDAYALAICLVNEESDAGAA